MAYVDLVDRFPDYSDCLHCFRLPYDREQL